MLAAILGGFGWLFMTASARNVALADNLCPLSGPTEQKLILVDVSDAIAPITRQDLLNRLHDVAVNTPKGALLELRVLEPGTTNSRALFSYCNPGDGAELDSLTGNPERARRRWEQGFNVPLEEALNASTISGEADTSPIMGAIQELVVEHLGTEEGRTRPTTLYVASDLLENTALFSIYQSGPDFDAYRASSAARTFATDLAGAEVRFWVIGRATAVPSARIADFWAAWVLENRGSFAGATALQGIM
ncbi:hypothetical protein C4375_03640 [Devosia sp. I507]|nr:hypothetical protein C4375_03640 [Devosia sp. I507]